nr:permease [uncultured Caproiciproducens sp.]
MSSVFGWIVNFLSYIVTAFVRLILGLFKINDSFLDSQRYKGAVEFFFADAIVLFLMIIAITFVVSIIRSFFPPERTQKLLGEQGTARGFVGNVAAALLGVVTPFCSCSAVPVFIGFIEAGIPLGVTFSFLISSPMVNEVALALLWGLFGWKTALLYIATGLTIAIVSGVIIGKLKMEKYLVEDMVNMKMGSVDIVKPTWKQRISDAWKADLSTLKSIWIHILIGLSFGAVVQGWTPGAWFTNAVGASNLFAVPIAVLVGIPMYSNAAGVLPIVSSLTKLGVPMGTALAFMMAVTALSLPSIIILRRVLKPKLLAVFVGIMAVTIIFVGYLFNFVLA